jgi:hypothetical protein
VAVNGDACAAAGHRPATLGFADRRQRFGENFFRALVRPPAPFAALAGIGHIAEIRHVIESGDLERSVDAGIDPIKHGTPPARGKPHDVRDGGLSASGSGAGASGNLQGGARRGSLPHPGIRL